MTITHSTIEVHASRSVVVRYVTSGNITQVYVRDTGALLGTIECRPAARPSFRWSARTAGDKYVGIHKTRKAAAEHILHNAIRLGEPAATGLAKDA